MRTARSLTLAAAVLTAAAGCTDAGPLGPEPLRRDGTGDEPADRLRASALSAIPFGPAPSDGPCLAEGQRFGGWELRYNGYGCVAIESPAPESLEAAVSTAAGLSSAGTSFATTLFMAPTEARSMSETHAPLVLGPAHGDRVTLRASVETLQHTRRGATPNPWEVAWVVWQYQDDEHFYYFIPKPNGWELGKRDPAYPGGQRFLATGRDRLFPIGRVHHVTVRQAGTLLTVAVDGVPVVQFRDDERPYLRGRVALYAEDAAIRVHRVAAL